MRCGSRDPKAGSATHAPRPRKKCRRFIAAKRCSAAEAAGVFMGSNARKQVFRTAFRIPPAKRRGVETGWSTAIQFGRVVGLWQGGNSVPRLGDNWIDPAEPDTTLAPKRRCPWTKEKEKEERDRSRPTPATT